jgi:hypothetical protein
LVLYQTTSLEGIDLPLQQAEAASDHNLAHAVEIIT